MNRPYQFVNDYVSNQVERAIYMGFVVNFWVNLCLVIEFGDYKSQKL